MALETTQHNLEIHENRRAWRDKDVLRQAYGTFYRAIAAQLAPQQNGLNVELGSGMGNIKAYIPDCITTDIFDNPWLDRVENAYKLSFANEEVANLILFDVWHHLEYPANALAEAARVLGPRGRLIVMDPAMSLAGKVVYGLFHHEPLRLKHTFPPRPIPMEIPSDLPYFAAQSSAHRLLELRLLPDLLRDWSTVYIQRITSFTYLASGGFRGRQLYPSLALPLMRRIDGFLGKWPGLFAARLLVVLERK
jgi:SAM-dependent methyltransferase